MNQQPDNFRARTPGKGRPRRPGRGLPEDKNLLALAKTYLETQRRLWPELVGTGVLPELDEAGLAGMMDQFRSTFLEGIPAAFDAWTARRPWSGLAASYLRYSDPNSNPRSLDQQLKLQLERARRDDLFVPWTYVFADAAVSGTTADRRGYVLSKQSLGRQDIVVLYIDEIGRASRDSIEALQLGRLVDQANKRLIGVSDGFDSASQHSKLTLAIFAMIHEAFVDQLRKKVDRGMADAFERGTNLHPPSLGYRLEPALDERGRPLLGKDGKELKKKIVEPTEVDDVMMAFRVYVEERRSLMVIAQDFNRRSVGGMQSWDHRTIAQLIRRHTYVGIEITHRISQVRDRETGQIHIKIRPKKEWRIRRRRDLQIVPWKLWKTAQRRLKETQEAYAKRRNESESALSRIDVYPIDLIRPTCGSCGAKLVRGHSSRYPSLCCPNGRLGKKGCELRGYKSVRIVERAILGELRERIFTVEFLGAVVEAANGHLVEIAHHPRADTGPLESEARKVKSIRDRLVKLITDQGEDGLESIVAEIRSQERRLKELRGQIEAIKVLDRPVPPPMTPADVAGLMDDLGDLLSNDVAIAAPLLKRFTGEILVYQDLEEGNAKPAWVATFTIDAVSLIAKLSAARNHPTTGTWEFLSTSGWTLSKDYGVLLEEQCLYHRYSRQVLEMVEAGMKLRDVAEALGIDWDMAQGALHFATTGRQAHSQKEGWRARSRKRDRTPRHVQIADEVLRLRDQEFLPFDKIARRLETSTATVVKAYDLSHPDLAAVKGRRRGSPPRLGIEMHHEILRRLDSGQTPQEVADAVGCCRMTVYRIRKAAKRTEGMPRGAA